MRLLLFAANLTCVIEGRGRPAPVKTIHELNSPRSAPVAGMFAAWREAAKKIMAGRPLISTASHQSHCLLRANTSCSVAASHSLTVLSAPPVASRFPSGEKATDMTLLECPLRVNSSCPVTVSHSLTVLSALPVASRFPSGEKATDMTLLECPLRVNSSCPVAAFHSLAVPSKLPVASRFPSGEKATDRTALD